MQTGPITFTPMLLQKQHFEGHVSHIIDASLSKNHKFPYHKSDDIYNHFRLQFDLPLSWSPPVDNVINFLLSLN